MSLSCFHPAVAKWFEGQFGTPTEPQRLGWPAIQSGQHTLISAPTGSGKTLAAFLASLDQLFRDGLEGKLSNETRVVYVSPLKALSNDIHKNLDLPLSGIRSILKTDGYPDVEVRAEVRTGDTPQFKRQAIARNPPHLLVTTPESLYLLLTSESGRRALRTTRTVIVDEIHAVVNNRRGSHLALSIERLAQLAESPLQRIGLSATQKPIEEVARFLAGMGGLDDAGIARCEIVAPQPRREFDLAIEIPSSPLEAVMANEIWDEIYKRVAELIESHRTTLIFVNTRRMAERLTHHLTARLGAENVTSHHGSLSAKLRLDAENRLKRGELKALVATASLELGIDIGSVDLVCQLGSTRSISTFLQRVGRAEHRRGGLPKGRLFPLSRDELIECAALVRCVRKGELDCLRIPEKPLDILAQQLAACAASEDWDEEKLFQMIRRAYPYRNLTRTEFDEVLRMLAEGFSTKRGRRGALVHYDAVNRRVRGRRGARLTALTSGGAIPDNADYRVVLDPTETFIGTVNEDFAIESMAGDVFQLGNASWRILRVNSGIVRVADAQGQPPSIPFWLGEAPARTSELSRAVSELRADIDRRLERKEDTTEWLQSETGLTPRAAIQIIEYLGAVRQLLGTVPSQDKVILERFFDESGGMQLVLHAPFGSRLNRAWGLALRKRFCRKFNFELQAAATEDALVLSLGLQHSFPLEEVFHYLNSTSVRELLVQALLDAPMFTVRWRWNAARALAVPRRRGNQRNPPPLQRMQAEDLLAAIFPDQIACLENIVGDREVPDHPLVAQTIHDCLIEAMDIDELTRVLERIEAGTIECLARDLPEPSPLAHEILSARPYAFLDNAPLEERRTQAVYRRRAREATSNSELGILDANAIARVCHEAWPTVENTDELHELLLLAGVLVESEIQPGDVKDEKDSEAKPASRVNGKAFLEELICNGRAGQLVVSSAAGAKSFWIAAERLAMLRVIFIDGSMTPNLTAPESEAVRTWERGDAIRELIRGRLELSGPVAASELAEVLSLPNSEIDAGLLALEAEGFVLRGQFRSGAKEREWCERRLLARIHRLTINRLRSEIQPVAIAEFCRFLTVWQHVDSEHRVEGPDGLAAVLAMLDGFELPISAWEPDVLSARVNNYSPHDLDRQCLTGRVGWGRMSAPQNQKLRAFAPLRSSPITLYSRERLTEWLELGITETATEFSDATSQVASALAQGGALFFAEIVGRTRLLPSQVEQALSELAARGLATSDSFEGLRAMLIPSHKRAPVESRAGGPRSRATKITVESGGRWSLLRKLELATPDRNGMTADGAAELAPRQKEQSPATDQAIETYARTLLRRYGIVFRKMLEREVFKVSWFDLGRVYRRLEARGEIRGGHFITGVSGEQFALPEAVSLLRTMRKAARKGELIALSAADPLNLVGILTPGARIAAIASNRILLQDGLPIAALEAGEIRKLESDSKVLDEVIERALLVGKLPPVLRPYYG